MRIHADPDPDPDPQPCGQPGYSVPTRQNKYSVHPHMFISCYVKAVQRGGAAGRVQALPACPTEGQSRTIRDVLAAPNSQTFSFIERKLCFFSVSDPDLHSFYLWVVDLDRGKVNQNILFYEKNCEWSKTKTFLWEILVIPYSDDSLFCVHYSIFIKAWVLTPGTRTDPNLDPD